MGRRGSVIALLVLLAVSGCALVPSRVNNEVQIHSWTPPLGTPPFRSKANPSKPTLLISTPRADPGFDTPRMVYLTQPYTLGYYANHHWVDTPPRMLMPLLAEAMERTGWFRSVLQMPTSLPGDYRLDVDITQLQQEFLQRPSQVRLRLRAHLVELRAPRLLEQRTFEVTEPAASDDPYGGVVATNRALGRLLADIAAWATSLLSQRGSV